MHYSYEEFKSGSGLGHANAASQCAGLSPCQACENAMQVVFAGNTGLIGVSRSDRICLWSRRMGWVCLATGRSGYLDIIKKLSRRVHKLGIILLVGLLLSVNGIALLIVRYRQLIAGFKQDYVRDCKFGVAAQILSGLVFTAICCILSRSMGIGNYLVWLVTLVDD